MNLEDLAQTIWARLDELVVTPLAQFCGGFDQEGRTVLYVLLATAAIVGFVLGGRWTGRSRRRRPSV